MVYAPGRWACSSAGEHYVDIVGVAGSIPAAPTIEPRYRLAFRACRPDPRIDLLANEIEANDIGAPLTPSSGGEIARR